MRAEATAADRARVTRRVIHIFLGGGPPHQDMWEIKTEAPSEIRGEFRPITTNVPGIQIGEVFPRIASIMDRCAVIRSVVGAVDRHEPYQCHTGWTRESLATLGRAAVLGFGHFAAARPGRSLGAAVRGPGEPGRVERSRARPAILGPAYVPFLPDGPGMANMRLNDISLDRLEDRKPLRASFDGFRRIVDAQGRSAAFDSFTERAFDVLTSSRLLDALDLGKEDPKVRERYGTGKPFNYTYDGANTDNEHLLMARRLVQAGRALRDDDLRPLGQPRGELRPGARSRLEARSGLQRPGRRSRSPRHARRRDGDRLGRVRPHAADQQGRRPRPLAASELRLLAGGGMKTGQAIGSTDRLGGYAHSRPVHVQEVVATLYHNLGIDTASTTIQDPTGRPQYLVEHPPISELV